MRFCSKCGKQIRENNKFCRYCGAKVNSTDQIKHDSNTKLIQSGTAINNNQTFDNKKDDDNKKKIYIGGAVVLIVLVIILVALLNNNNSDYEYDDNYYSDADYNDDYYGDADYSDNYESYYDIVKKDITWEEAYEEASSYGGELASIHSYDEFEEICNLADQYDLKVVWVGAYREDYENWEDVYWIDGTEMSFTQWYDGEPSYNYEGIEEQYLMIFKVGDTWYFNDSENDISNPEYYYLGKMGYAIFYE